VVPDVRNLQLSFNLTKLGGHVLVRAPCLWGLSHGETNEAMQGGQYKRAPTPFCLQPWRGRRKKPVMDVSERAARQGLFFLFKVVDGLGTHKLSYMRIV
jgi:hypothetical protein